MASALAVAALALMRAACSVAAVAYKVAAAAASFASGTSYLIDAISAGSMFTD